MESRKIQKVSGGTYTVSLPKEWAEAENCTTGTVVDIHTHIDGSLVIQTPEAEQDPPTHASVTVDTGDPTEIEQLIRASYAAGAESLALEFPDGYTDEQYRTVERVSRDLAGTTVAEESSDRVTVKTLLDPAEVSIRQSVRQLQFVSLSMHRDAVATLRDGVRGSHWSDRDDQADRLHGMIDRYFERGLARLDEIDALGLDRTALFGLWLTARELERVADHAERIALTVERLAETPPEAVCADVEALSEDSQRIVEDAVTVAVGDASVDSARNALKRRRAVQRRVRTLSQDLFERRDASYRTVRILDSLSRTAEHGGNIAEYGLRMAVRDGTLDGAVSDPEGGGAATEP